MIEKFAENVVESKEQFLRESVGKENAQIQGKPGQNPHGFSRACLRKDYIQIDVTRKLNLSP